MVDFYKDLIEKRPPFEISQITEINIYIQVKLSTTHKNPQHSNLTKAQRAKHICYYEKNFPLLVITTIGLW